MRVAILAAAAALRAAAAAAGPQYVDPGGYALGGFDPVAYHEEAAPTPGDAAIVVEWNGATWAFASEANRDRRLADPRAFAPADDGHCACGAAGRYKAPGDPHRWAIVDGRLVLNLDAAVQARWDRDRTGWIAQGPRRGGRPSTRAPPRSAGRLNCRGASPPGPADAGRRRRPQRRRPRRS